MAVTATAGPVTKVGSNYEFTVTHNALPDSITASGVMINGAGVEGAFSASGEFPVSSRIDNGGGRTWTATEVDATHTKFTAPV